MSCRQGDRGRREAARWNRCPPPGADRRRALPAARPAGDHRHFQASWILDPRADERRPAGPGGRFRPLRRSRPSGRQRLHRYPGPRPAGRHLPGPRRRQPRLEDAADGSPISARQLVPRQHRRLVVQLRRAAGPRASLPCDGRLHVHHPGDDRHGGAATTASAPMAPSSWSATGATLTACASSTSSSP